jgi:hippurate hydrolase
MLVTFNGSGGHGSTPWLAKEPVSALLEAASALQTMVTKRFSPFDPVILNIGWLRAGETATTNVVPENASFGATIRTFSDENYHLVRQHAKDLVEKIAEGFGLTADVEFSSSSQVLINDSAAVNRVERVIEQTLGAGRYQTMPSPIAGGEDFASILKEVPGAFIFLGASLADEDPETAPFNHSNKAKFDDSVIASGVAVLSALVFDTLK